MDNQQHIRPTPHGALIPVDLARELARRLAALHAAVLARLAR